MALANNIPRSENDKRDRFTKVTPMDALCVGCKQKKMAHVFDHTELHTLCQECYDKIIAESMEPEPGLTPDQEITAEVIMMITRIMDRVSALERRVKMLESTPTLGANPQST